jgi:Zn-dependent metalloprotease
MQVSHMRDKTHDFQVNHGIPNKAAYLIGEKIGRQAMADVYMNALRNHMGWSASFKSTANATVASAAELFGKDSTQTTAVRDAWTAVGVLNAARK